MGGRCPCRTGVAGRGLIHCSPKWQRSQATEDHEAELDEMAAMLESAGLLIQTVDEGKPALQLTPKGAQVANQMAMSSEEDPFAMFNALLVAAEGSTSV